ncbi:MAG: hypothetical protein QN131_10810 [Armatimonadota bacterium]|nr:hypothetical protein [Armatimonadota bacterium]MDR7550408.1 hypothetical protein [Armatimonadota bacterium]
MADPLSRRGLLIVSLPRNDAALARAAASAGADLLKVHVNVRHRASGTRFGSLDDEEDAIAQVLDVGLPTGLVPGEDAMVTPDQIPRLRRFAFLDAFVTRLPLFLYDVGVPVIPAIPHDYPAEALGSLGALPGEWLEAALVPPQGYGLDPVADDLVALARLGALSRRRLIVPSQRRIRPEDLGRYFAIPQVWAVMIGAVVTGRTARGLGRATEAFRRALDALVP